MRSTARTSKSSGCRLKKALRLIKKRKNRPMSGGPYADAPTLPHTEQHPTVEASITQVKDDRDIMDAFTKGLRTGDKHNIQELEQHGGGMITDFLGRHTNRNNDTRSLLQQCRRAMDEANKAGRSPIKPAETALKAMKSVIGIDQSGKTSIAQGVDARFSKQTAITPTDVHATNKSLFDQLNEVGLGPTESGPDKKGFKTNDNYLAARKWLLDQYPKGNTSHAAAVIFITDTLSRLKPGKPAPKQHYTQVKKESRNRFPGTQLQTHTRLPKPSRPTMKKQKNTRLQLPARARTKLRLI